MYKPMPFEMYRIYVDHNVERLNTLDEKLFWLLMEERHITVEATKATQQASENSKTPVLLAYMDRLSYLRTGIEDVYDERKSA